MEGAIASADRFGECEVVPVLAAAPPASCPVPAAPTPSFAWVVQLFAGSLVSEVKKFISAGKNNEGGINFLLDQFPDPIYLPGLQMVELAQLRGQW